MFILRRAHFLCKNAVIKADLPSHNKVYKVTVRSFSSGNENIKTMVDPKRVVSYEDVLKGMHEPKKVIIDVRNPEEVSSTGQIPSSINIPLRNVNSVLSMPHDEFRKQYKHNKPMPDDELIFYCKSGRRATEALDQALKLGFNNSKTYLGSWDEWTEKQK